MTVTCARLLYNLHNIIDISVCTCVHVQETLDVDCHCLLCELSRELTEELLPPHGSCRLIAQDPGT